MTPPARTSVFPPRATGADATVSGPHRTASVSGEPLGITPGADVLVRIDGTPYRLAGARVRRIVELDRILPVPGLPPPAEGVAIAEDHVTVVVRVGASADAHFALLYDWNDTRIALVGAEVMGFSVDDAIPAYDVEVMFARIDATVWAARAARRSLHSPKSAP
jgi:cobyrinic acid a,c-diamide synthase